jgi:hypothetical protein
MHNRLRLFVASLALLALSLLSLRATALHVLGVPPAPADMQSVTYGDEGEHCRMIAICHVISVASAPLDLSGTTQLPLLLGLMLLLPSETIRRVLSRTEPMPSPPPRQLSA